MEEKTKGGLFIPDSGKDEDNPLRGKVVSVGEGLIEGGRQIPLTVKVGDIVRCAANSGTIFKEKNVTYFAMRENQVMCVVPE
jgi:co-chaperonin GroES (HSP10)